MTGAPAKCPACGGESFTPVAEGVVACDSCLMTLVQCMSCSAYEVATANHCGECGKAIRRTAELTRIAAEQVSSSRECRPESEVRLRASVHEHMGQTGSLFALYGQPCVSFDEAGDVHTPHRDTTVSVLPEALWTPRLQGRPCAFGDPVGILETGGLVLQVGEEKAALWPSRFVTDAQWSGRVRAREDACSLHCSDAGFSRFTGGFTWLSEERFLLSGEVTGDPGRFGLRVFRWRLDGVRLSVDPEGDSPTVLPGTGEGRWLARMLPVADSGRKLVVVSHGATLWQVDYEAKALCVRGRFQYDGVGVQESSVVTSLSREHDHLLMKVTRYDPTIGFPGSLLEQWVLKPSGEISHEQVHGPRTFINDAQEVMAGQTRLIFTGEASGQAVLRSVNALQDSWCEFGNNNGTFHKLALGPGYVAAVGDYPSTGGKRYLWTGSMHRGASIWRESDAIGEAVEEDLQLIATPGAVVLYASRVGRRRIEVYGLTRTDSAG